jgi:hypothetical protein
MTGLAVPLWPKRDNIDFLIFVARRSSRRGCIMRGPIPVNPPNLMKLFKKLTVINSGPADRESRPLSATSCRQCRADLKEIASFLKVLSYRRYSFGYELALRRVREDKAEKINRLADVPILKNCKSLPICGQSERICLSQVAATSLDFSKNLALNIFKSLIDIAKVFRLLVPLKVLLIDELG